MSTDNICFYEALKEIIPDYPQTFLLKQGSVIIQALPVFCFFTLPLLSFSSSNFLLLHFSSLLDCWSLSPFSEVMSSAAVSSGFSPEELFSGMSLFWEPVLPDWVVLVPIILQGFQNKRLSWGSLIYFLLQVFPLQGLQTEILRFDLEFNSPVNTI